MAGKQEVIQLVRSDTKMRSDVIVTKYGLLIKEQQDKVTTLEEKLLDKMAKELKSVIRKAGYTTALDVLDSCGCEDEWFRVYVHLNWKGRSYSSSKYLHVATEKPPNIEAVYARADELRSERDATLAELEKESNDLIRELILYGQDEDLMKDVRKFLGAPEKVRKEKAE